MEALVAIGKYRVLLIKQSITMTQLGLSQDSFARKLYLMWPLRMLVTQVSRLLKKPMI